MPAFATEPAPVAGRFVLETQAGSGGMGTVYRARDMLTNRTVALKLLHPGTSLHGTERFAREAELLAELQHPGIVTYLAHGKTEAGQAYLAMEWLDGEDLARRLCRGPLRLSEALALLRRAAEALAVAHARGVVHRDLKPSNLFLRRGEVGRVALLDFGIAWHADVSQILTRTGAIIGTPSYMAPEQACAERQITPAADIFSLGCVLFECLTGQSPFGAGSAVATLARIVLDEPPRLRCIRPEMPETVEALLGRMLAKQVRNRHANAAAVLAALEALDDIVPPVAPAPGTMAADQQLLSVLIATSPLGASATLGSVEMRVADARLDELYRELSVLGIRLEVLAGGILAATLRHTRGAATDHAALAVRCALLIKARWPAVTIAVGTGRGLVEDRRPAGEVFERTAALLRDHGGTPAEQVLVDDVTRGLLEVRFVVRKMPAGAYALTGEELALDASRPLLGKPTPCVGRDLELDLLESTLEGCIEDSEPHAVLVIAPPGAGKSRLRHEFLRRLEARGDDVTILIGRGDPMSAGSSYSLLGQALRRLCGIRDGDSPECRRIKLAQRIGDHIAQKERDHVVVFMGELCGVRSPDAAHVKLRAARRDPQLMTDHLTQAMLDVLRAECAARPVLLVLEDLHWSDALTVKLVDAARCTLRTCPLMVLALARPEVHELFPGWPDAAQVVALRPLGSKAAARLVQQVLGDQLPQQTVARIVEQSEGNALLLEELIRAVAEGRGDAVPETVLAMLLARLSQLDFAARHVLRIASVFGETFTRDGVAALLGPESGRIAVDRTLVALVQSEFIESRGELREAGQEQYKFRHALVRDAAYSLLPEEHRITAHLQACTYLDQVGGIDPGILAEHAHQGQDLRRAAHFYVEAAQRALASGHALATFNLDTAQRFVEGAIECGVSDQQLGTVRAIQAWTAHFLSDAHFRVGSGYTDALAAVEGLVPGSFWWIKAITIYFFSLYLLDHTEHADRLIQAFLETNPDADTRAAYMEAGEILGFFFAITGARRSCDQLVHKLSLVASDMDPHGRAHLLMTTAWRAHYLQPAPFEAVQAAQQAVALFRNKNDRHRLPRALFGLGIAFTAIGLVAKGEEILREARAVATANRNAFGSTMLHVHLGLNLATQPAPAKQQEARRIGETYRDQAQLGLAVRGAAHQIVAQVVMSSGDLEAAEPIIQTSLACLSAVLPYRLSVVPLAVERMLKQGRHAEAREAAEEALRLLEEQGGLGACEVPLRRAVTLARFADGDLEGGCNALRDALAQLRLRAAEIEDPEMRQSYLVLPENQQILDLARAHGQ